MSSTFAFAIRESSIAELGASLRSRPPRIAVAWDQKQQGAWLTAPWGAGRCPRC
jgi:hypothetical protein